LDEAERAAIQAVNPGGELTRGQHEVATLVTASALGPTRSGRSSSSRRSKHVGVPIVPENSFLVETYHPG
jgi:hypothetical protein